MEMADQRPHPGRGRGDVHRGHVFHALRIMRTGRPEREAQHADHQPGRTVSHAAILLFVAPYASGEESKACFFEKKKQKTFASLG
jgi:hypothetical protein